MPQLSVRHTRLGEFTPVGDPGKPLSATVAVRPRRLSSTWAILRFAGLAGVVALSGMAAGLSNRARRGSAD